MKQIRLLSIGASSSSNSINRVLAKFSAEQIGGAEVTSPDLSQWTIPLYSQDLEEAEGIAQVARDFFNLIREADGIVLSLAEHNGSYTAAFKSLLDWTSRLERELWQNKPMFLLSTSPGPRAGSSVMEAAKSRFPFLGANIVTSFSLPSFHDNFSMETGISNEELNADFQSRVAAFQKALLEE